MEIEKKLENMEGRLFKILLINDKISPQSENLCDMVYEGKNNGEVSFIERGLPPHTYIINTYKINLSGVSLRDNSLLLKWSKICFSALSTIDIGSKDSEKWKRKNKLLEAVGH